MLQTDSFKHYVIYLYHLFINMVFFFANGRKVVPKLLTIFQSPTQMNEVCSTQSFQLYKLVNFFSFELNKLDLCVNK